MMQQRRYDFWVTQTAEVEMPDGLDDPRWDDFHRRCKNVQATLMLDPHITDVATFTAHDGITLSGVVSSTSPLGAQMDAAPRFFAALEAGEMVQPDQWVAHKCKRLRG